MLWEKIHFALQAFSLFLAHPPHLLACSIFMAAKGLRVLVGNNEDDPPFAEFMSPKLTFHAALGGEEFGTMVHSFEDGYPEGGMNTSGLFFDITQVPESPVPAHYPPGTPDLDCPPGALLDRILTTCSTVKEALSAMKSSRLAGIEAAQVFFADAQGDAAVVSLDKEGLVTVTPKRGDFLL